EEGRLAVEGVQRQIRERGLSGEQSKLVERDAGLHAHGKRLRRDFQIECAAVAGADLVEPWRGVGDDARENVEPTSGRFRIRAAADVVGQRGRLEKRDEVHPATLKRHARARPRQLVDHKIALGETALTQTALHGLAKWQEARSQLIRLRTQPEVQARRLELAVIDAVRRRDPAVANSRAKLAI